MLLTARTVAAPLAAAMTTMTAAAVLVGCSSGSRSVATPSTAPAGRLTGSDPARWTGVLCSGLSTIRQVEPVLQQAAGAVATDPGAALTTLDGGLSSLRDQLGQLAKSLTDVGAPATAGGAEAQAGLVGAVGAAAAQLATIVTALEAAKGADAQGQAAAVQTAGTQTSSALAAVRSALDGLPALDTDRRLASAEAANPACAGLVGSSPSPSASTPTSSPTSSSS